MRFFLLICLVLLDLFRSYLLKFLYLFFEHHAPLQISHVFCFLFSFLFSLFFFLDLSSLYYSLRKLVVTNTHSWYGLAPYFDLLLFLTILIAPLNRLQYIFKCLSNLTHVIYL